MKPRRALDSPSASRLPPGRWTVGDLFSPRLLAVATFVTALVMYIAYVVGWIKSFRLGNVSLSTRGIFLVLLFWAVFIVSLPGNSRRIRWVKPLPISPVRLRLVVLGCLGIIGLGFYVTFGEFIGSQSISDLLTAGSRGELLGDIGFGSGFTGLYVFAFPALVLAATYARALGRPFSGAVVALLLVILFMWASLLRARIIVVLAIIVVVLAHLRAKHVGRELAWRFLVAGALLLSVVLGFLVSVASVRDFGSHGYMYTDSQLAWGSARLSDYVISSTSYSIDLGGRSFDSLQFPSHSFAVLHRFLGVGSPGHDVRNVGVGSVEYTNTGAFGWLYLDFGLGFVGAVVLFGILVRWFWRAYKGGLPEGLICMPLLLYTVGDTLRLFFIGTVSGGSALLVGLVIGVLLRTRMGGRRSDASPATPPIAD